MKTHVEFRSDAFPPYDDREDETNPGRYGRRLAEFLVRGLQEKGFEPLEPWAEDWGWRVQIRDDRINLWIGCGHYDKFPGEWFLCFIEPHQPRVRRWLFWKVDASRVVSKLQEAIDQVLAENPAVLDRKWWTYDEFNRPAKNLENYEYIWKAE